MVESFLLIILITVNFFGVFDVCVGVFVLVVSLLGFDMIGGSGKEHLRLAFLLELPVKKNKNETSIFDNSVIVVW